MKLLVGCTRKRDYIRRMQALGWGRLFTAETPKPLPGEAWGLDNGVFGCSFLGRRGAGGTQPWTDPGSRTLTTADRFLAAVHKTERGLASGRLHPPLFVALPDLVADPASLDYSIAWWEQTGRWFDLPWYLVLQNGMTARAVTTVLLRYPFHGLFLGGDDDFKLTAASWCRLAHRLGRRFHFARVSTLPRLRAAHAMGADSADTTQPIRTDRDFERFAKTWVELEGLPSESWRDSDSGRRSANRRKNRGPW